MAQCGRGDRLRKYTVKSLIFWMGLMKEHYTKVTMIQQRLLTFSISCGSGMWLFTGSMNFTVTKIHSQIISLSIAWPSVSLGAPQLKHIRAKVKKNKKKTYNQFNILNKWKWKWRLIQLESILEIQCFTLQVMYTGTSHPAFLTVLDDAMFKKPPSQLLRLLPGCHLTLLQQPVNKLWGHQRPLKGPTFLLSGLY